MILNRNRKRGLGWIAMGGAAMLLATVAQPAQAAEPETSGVARQLQKTLAALKFGEVLDTEPPTSTQAAKSASVDVDPERKLAGRDRAPKLTAAALAAATQIHQQPNVDVTVLELDGKGRPVSSGTVVTSPTYKDGVIVPVDRNFHTTAVRYRHWDTNLWNTGNGQGDTDVVPGRENAPIDFMSPYPASTLKLMVGFGILQLVDNGTIKLDDTYAYQPTQASDLCGTATTDTVRNYFDRMITVSDNGSACSLIKLLNDKGAIDGLNQTFQDIGLEALQLKGTNPANGGTWTSGINMSSLDTAKLLALVNGVSGTAWTAPNGKPVTSDVLSASSREFFMKELGDQGWNNVLSTTNYCGYTYPTAGMPQRISQRWIGADGTVTVNEDPTDGKYLYPVQPCQDAAQVTFAHKTGISENAVSDAGIVTSLPGKPNRRYIIAAFSNLGYRYIDANRQDIQPSVNRTEKFAILGRTMDTYESQR
ncbi:class A beta-lactamase-related serine hydrolase [Actinoallomurus purpureus]|uniref:serine hydrolase n=1 Tax=Actinoallomurus purpureus TaxID=478114 RepID=UPI0020931F12|nr:serine hydrolase [Actinoallomurus purpureus]MCO6004450.1 class A beta-lactamase-related serine hydrolase [Actinoallomurus purpureus]